MPIAVIFPLVNPPYIPEGIPGRWFARIESREVFIRSVEVYARRDSATQRIVVVAPDDLQEIQERFAGHLGFQGVTVAGGTSDWFGCVNRGLERLEENIDLVSVHDPCCPAVPFPILDAMEDALARNKSAAGVVPVLPTRSVFADLEGKPTSGGTIHEYVEMSKVYQVQSPQLFRRKPLAEAHAKRAGKTFIDDAELLVDAGHKILTVPGSPYNQRIDSEELTRLGKDLLDHLPKPKSKTPLNPFGEAEW